MILMGYDWYDVVNFLWCGFIRKLGNWSSISDPFHGRNGKNGVIRDPHSFTIKTQMCHGQNMVQKRYGHPGKIHSTGILAAGVLYPKNWYFEICWLSASSNLPKFWHAPFPEMPRRGEIHGPFHRLVPARSSSHSFFTAPTRESL